MDSEIVNKLKVASKGDNNFFNVLYAVSMNESGGNTLAHASTSTEDSRGLFQVNLKAHPNANASQLFNPDYNIAYMLPTLKASYDEALGKGLKGVDVALYVEKNGERPQWTPTVIGNVTKYFNEITGGNADLQSIPIISTIDGTVGPTGIVNKIMDSIKFGAVYFVLLALLLFGMYVTFISQVKSVKEVIRWVS